MVSAAAGTSSLRCAGGCLWWLEQVALPAPAGINPTHPPLPAAHPLRSLEGPAAEAAEAARQQEALCRVESASQLQPVESTGEVEAK